MGYALFANNKVALTGRVNSISLQQTQRSNEQNVLATEQLSLQQNLSSIQASQSLELSELYKVLSNINAAGKMEDDFIKKTDAKPGTRTNNKGEEEATYVQGGAQELDLSFEALGLMYDIDSMPDDTTERASAARNKVNDAIKAKQSEFDSQLADINNEIYMVGVKENVIEMEVKRLDTALSSAQKQLDAVIDAEGDAVDKATPKFSGNG